MQSMCRTGSLGSSYHASHPHSIAAIVLLVPNPDSKDLIMEVGL